MHEHIRSPTNFDKQISKNKLLDDVIKPLNEKRFDYLQDISEWNSKFASKISQPFG